MTETASDIANDLVNACTSARLKGFDFPTIWHEILKKHPFVVGLPTQGRDDNEPVLEVQLITGHRLIYNAIGFSIS
jgi:hypothetical protein